jgi:hypothetical protein
MRSFTRWVFGAGIVVTLALAAVPSGAALPIDGSLAWNSAAQVAGLIHVETADVPYVRQHVPPNAPEQEYGWSMTVDRLVVHSSEREEPASWDILSQRTGEQKWNNQTYEFRSATIYGVLNPTKHYGATGLYQSASPHAAAWKFTPEPRDPAMVRSVDLTAALMTVPASAHPGRPGHSYESDTPRARLLEVSGALSAEAHGDLTAALFGWRVIVTLPDAEGRTFETGVRTIRDPYTGIPKATVLQYVLLEAQGGDLRLKPMDQDTLVYTAALRYAGAAAFPEGHYEGAHEEHAPRDASPFPVNGQIWLATLQTDRSPREHLVRAWGQSDWRVAAVPDAPAPLEPSILPFILASAGLFVGTQLLPQLGRALRFGGFLLYARLRDQSPDANPTRERIYQVVCAEPGLNLSRIVDQLGIGWGTAAYHVQILKRQARVRELRFLNRVCFFPAEDHQEDKQLQTVLLRQPNYREVMQVLESSPGLSQREVASRTGHARQYISRLVAKMERAGLVRAEPSRTGRRYYPLAAQPFTGSNCHSFDGNEPNGNGHAPAPLAPAPGF